MARLTSRERAVLAIPLIAGLVFGIGPLLLQPGFAAIAGFSGDDPYVYRLAGAATLGYAVAVGVGIRGAAWGPLRFVVLAILVFNIVSIPVCLVEVALGRARPIVYLIFAASIVLILIAGWLLARHRGSPSSGMPASRWVIVAAALGTGSALFFGVLPEFPGFLRQVGLRGTDEFVFRQAGAATLGYAAMGVGELGSRRWDDMRLPTWMAVTFNTAAGLASVVSISVDGPTLLSVVVAPAALLFAIAFAVALARRGR